MILTYTSIAVALKQNLNPDFEDFKQQKQPLTRMFGFIFYF